MSARTSYWIKESFYSLQGEGAQVGRPAVFCRFAGCNLWSGRAADRERAVCTFCDTDFRGTDGTGGGRFRDAATLAARLCAHWPDETTVAPYLVCTGGEPLLQLDAPLIAALHARGCEIAVETNGTRPAPAGLDWICVSPKADAPLKLTAGNELKLVYPQSAAPPERFASLAFQHFFLQPRAGPQLALHTAHAIAYCKAHPRWRLSVQTQLLLGIP